jgi:regulator of sigma E protease
MFLDVITFIIVLSVLVLVHEFGHFITARKSGILVEEFGFGIPPKIFGFKKGETLYSINLLPFGGFVRLHGENFGDTVTQKDRSYLGKSKKVRSMVVVAGVLMNFLLAIVLFGVVYSFSGIPKKSGYVEIVDVMEGTPADEAGFMDGDIIKTVDGQTLTDNDEFKSYISTKAGNEVSIEVVRPENKSEILKIVPREDPPANEGSLGVIIADTQTYYAPVWQRPFLGAYYGTKEAVFWGTAVLQGFGMMIGKLFIGQVPRDVTGPAGLLVITSEVAKVGFMPLLNWMGIISINLGILNILPIPALDGGRLAFIFLEKLFGRRVLPKVESALHAISLGLLITLLLVVTFKEVKLISKLGFSGYMEYLSQVQSP